MSKYSFVDQTSSEATEGEDETIRIVYFINNCILKKRDIVVTILFSSTDYNLCEIVLRIAAKSA